MKYTKLVFIIFLLNACTTKELKDEKVTLKSGIWRAEMDLGEASLPFHFSLDSKQQAYKIVIINGKEHIQVDEVRVQNDSIHINLPIFESEFHAKISADTIVEGVWINHYKSKDYQISFRAEYGKENRFNYTANAPINRVFTKYQVQFSPDSEKPSNAIGLFNQEGHQVTGTFATETGDYRHLDGIVTGDSMLLSTFDGSHAFLFKAKIYGDSLSGVFYSGTHWKEPWLAVKNENFELRDPDSLTFLKPGFDSFSFAFENQNGDTVRLSDSAFQGKVCIVQIMGSWCPNCLDETKYLSGLYDQYKSAGLAIVALAFERTRSREQAVKNLSRLAKRTKANYTFLLAGATRDDKAEEVLPMLNHIMSYPTALFIDKKGNIRKIHTGFYGPGTGELYTEFTRETEEFIQELLNE